MELDPILISVVGLIGSGLSAYVGVRVGLAEQKVKIEALKEQVDRIEHRMERLQTFVFSNRAVHGEPE